MIRRQRKGPPSGMKAGKVDQGLDGDQPPVEDKGQPVRDERFPNGNEDEDNGKDDSVDGNLVRDKILIQTCPLFEPTLFCFTLTLTDELAGIGNKLEFRQCKQFFLCFVFFRIYLQNLQVMISLWIR